MDASEREQYRAAIQGDREAFEMIIRTNSRALFAIAYGILQDRGEAEDVVHWQPLRDTGHMTFCENADLFPILAKG